MQTISSKSKFEIGIRFRQLVFGLLTALLFWLFAREVKPQYKISMINSLGIEPILNDKGEFRLSLVESLPGAQSGLKGGDILISVNGLRPSSDIFNDMQKLTLGPDGQMIVEVRGSSGTTRTVQISLDSPIPALFGFSPIALARIHSVLDILLVLGFSISALIIFWRKSQDRLGLFVSMTLLLMGFRFTDTILFTPNVMISLLVFLIYAISRILLLIFLFIFPTGTYIVNWTRRFVFFGALWSVISLFFPAFYGILGGILEIAILTVGLWSQIYRYRHVASVQERQQTKWIVFGIAVAFAVSYLVLLIGLLPVVRHSELGLMRYELLTRPLSKLSLLAIPLAIVISIFRYRLYEIDIIINRALVYGTLTAIVSGMSVTLIGFFQRFTLALTGEKTEAAIVLTTLVVASAITPLKSYLQTIVDTRFKEAPDAGRKLKAFTEEVSKRLFAVDPEQIARRLLEETVLAFQASSGAIYLNSNQPTYATRLWNGEYRLNLQIQGADRVHGILVLGPRGNGSEYTRQDRELIEGVARQIALAIEQDQVSAYLEGEENGTI